MPLISIKLDVDDKTFQAAMHRAAKAIGQLDNRPGDFVPSFDVSNLPGALRQVAAPQVAQRALEGMGTVGAGESGQAILQVMQSASQGIISNADLMAAANRALVLGVADSAEEMAALAEAAIICGRSAPSYP